MAKGDRGKRGREEYGRTERERGHERRERESRSQERREREAAKKAAEAKEEDKGVMDTLSDWASDAWNSAKDWAMGKEDTGGFSPMGGAASYGMTKQQFDKTIGKRRHQSRSLGQRLAREVDYFQEAPMDYVSDLLDNPLVSGAAVMTGTGIPALGVKVVDAAMDVFQGEQDPLGALGQVGAGAIQFSPVGAAIPGPLRAPVKAGLKKGAQAAAIAGAGSLGGTFGGAGASSIAGAFTDNPYARAGITAAGAAAGAWGGAKVASDAARRPSGPAQPDRTRRESDRRESPLVSSGERAVAASQRLMQQPDVDLYARTVQQLPYYGLSTPQQQLPYYGV